MAAPLRTTARTMTRRPWLAAGRALTAAIVSAALPLACSGSGDLENPARLASAAVMLIGLATLASLTLADLTSRLNELALRSALGASRTQLIVPEVLICAALAAAGAGMALSPLAWIASALVMLTVTGWLLMTLGGIRAALPLTPSSIRARDDAGARRMRTRLVAAQAALATVLLSSAAAVTDAAPPALLEAGQNAPGAGAVASPPSASGFVVACGAVGLLLAALSAYGMTARTVVDTTREAGVRLALGGRPIQVRWTIARLALHGVTGGAVLGSAIIAAAGAVLWKVSAHAPGPYWTAAIASAAAVLTAGLIASMLAARAAGHLDPPRVMQPE
jgi:ABC-type antimicrobial peptide transport system permease subunit